MSSGSSLYTDRFYVDASGLVSDWCFLTFSANSSDLSEMVSFKLRTAMSGKTRPDCSRVNTLEGWEVVSRDNWWVKPLLSDLRRWFIWTGILRLVMEVLLCDEGTQRALCESKEIPRSHGLTGILPLRWHATRGSLRISACLCAYRWIRVDERCIWVLCRKVVIGIWPCMALVRSRILSHPMRGVQ